MCLAQALYGAWSSDGQSLAFVTSQVDAPQQPDEWFVEHWEVQIYDAETNSTMVVGGRSQEQGGRAGTPQIVWNDAGTHFVVYTSTDF
jgi:hypothetical protein